MHKLWYASNKAYCRPVKMNELQRLKTTSKFQEHNNDKAQEFACNVMLFL